MQNDIYHQNLIVAENIYEKSFLKSVKEYIEYDSTLYTLAFSCTQSRAISFRFKEIYTKYFDISVCKKYLFLARLLNIIDRKSIIINNKYIIESNCRVILSNSICSYRVYKFNESIKQDLLASVESKKHNIQPVLVKL
jgi:hypothetical protein